MAEPKITQTAISLLETVANAPRKPWQLRAGPSAKAIAAMSPFAYWRLNEFCGPLAADETKNHRDAAFESHVTYYLEGPNSATFCAGEVNRAPHFVGGRLCADLAGLGENHTVSMWIWNGLPNDAREVNGWFYSRDHNHGLSNFGEHLGIGGTSGNTGKLVFQSSSGPVGGKTEILRWTWQHVVLVRDVDMARVYLNGELEIECKAPRVGIPSAFFGGRSDNDSNWEGRLDEIAVFDRALGADEVARLSVP